MLTTISSNSFFRCLYVYFARGMEHFSIGLGHFETNNNIYYEIEVFMSTHFQSLLIFKKCLAFNNFMSLLNIFMNPLLSCPFEIFNFLTLKMKDDSPVFYRYLCGYKFSWFLDFVFVLDMTIWVWTLLVLDLGPIRGKTIFKY